MPKLDQNEKLPAGIDSVVLTLRILESMAFKGRPGRVTELATELGTSKNRIHRYLQTLVDLGYVVRDDDTQRYSVGIRLVQLGSAVANQYDLLGVSRPVMRRLRDVLGYTVVLSKLVNGELFAIERVYGTSNVTVGIVIGSPLGLHSSAQGKCVLAFGPASLLEATCRRPLERLTPYTIREPSHLTDEIGAIRAQGWAVAPRETSSVLSAVAVPIFDGDDRLFATLAVLAPYDEIPGRPTARCIGELKDAAREISAALFGTTFRPDPPPGDFEGDE
jgi:IclR family KDG regulon transcriptional repressor